MNDCVGCGRGGYCRDQYRGGCVGDYVPLSPAQVKARILKEDRLKKKEEG